MRFVIHAFGGGWAGAAARVAWLALAVLHLASCGTAYHPREREAEVAAAAGRWEESITLWRSLAAEQPHRAEYFQGRVLETFESCANAEGKRGEWIAALTTLREASDEARHYERPADAARLAASFNDTWKRGLAQLLARGDGVAAFELLEFAVNNGAGADATALQEELRPGAVAKLSEGLFAQVAASDYSAAAETCLRLDRIEPRHPVLLRHRKQVWLQVLSTARANADRASADRAAKQLVSIDPSHPALLDYLQSQ
jgi:hypothetical protein